MLRKTCIAHSFWITSGTAELDNAAPDKLGATGNSGALDGVLVSLATPPYPCCLRLLASLAGNSLNAPCPRFRCLDRRRGINPNSRLSLFGSSDVAANGAANQNGSSRRSGLVGLRLLTRG